MKFKDFIDSFRGWHIAKLGDKYVVRMVSRTKLTYMPYTEWAAVCDPDKLTMLTFSTLDSRYRYCLHDSLEQAKFTLAMLTPKVIKC